MQEVFEKIIEKLEENQTIVFHLKGGKPTQSIDIVKAIEIVKQEAEQHEECYKDCGDCEAYDKENHHCPKFCKVITEAVKEIEENHNGWIPCNERLPKGNGYYYVTQIVKSISSGKKIATKKDYVEFSEGKWRRAKHIQVIAWLDIEPYQPKGE